MVKRRTLVTVPHRVPDDIAKRVFQRLHQDGSLAIVLDVLRDHRDSLVKRIERFYIHHPPMSKAEKRMLYMRHGAASEVDRVIATFEALGVSVQQAPQARAAGDR